VLPSALLLQASTWRSDEVFDGTSYGRVPETSIGGALLQQVRSWAFLLPASTYCLPPAIWPACMAVCSKAQHFWAALLPVCCCIHAMWSM
jgi:hypothetical protein